MGAHWYGPNGRGACGHCQHRERMARNLFCAECARSYGGALTLDEEAALDRRPIYAAHNSPVPMTLPCASVHRGPNGGVEFRLWSTADTFRVVGKFKAWPHLSEVQREEADRMARERKEAARIESDRAQSWREIMRGG